MVRAGDGRALFRGKAAARRIARELKLPAEASVFYTSMIAEVSSPTRHPRPFASRDDIFNLDP